MKSFPQLFTSFTPLPSYSTLHFIPRRFSERFETSNMGTPNKQEEPSSSPEQSMTASSHLSGPLSHCLSQERESSRDDSSNDFVVIVQPGENSLNALGALGSYALEHNENQASEEHENTQAGFANTTEDTTHVVSSNNPTQMSYQNRRSRRRGRTFDLSLLEYDLAHPRTRIARRRHRSMSEMECSVARGFIDSASPGPLSVGFCMDTSGFWDLESSHFCIRCGSDHF